MRAGRRAAQEAKFTKPAIVESVIEEIRRLKGSTDVGPRDIEEVLTLPAIARASKAGRTVSTQTVHEKFGGIDGLRDAVAGRLGFEREIVTAELILQQGLEELARLKASPDEVEIRAEDRNGQRSVIKQAANKHGLLTTAGVDRAARDGRMVPMTLVRKYFGDLETFNERLAELAGVRTQPVTKDDVLRAAGREIALIIANPTLREIRSIRDGKEYVSHALDPDNLLTAAGVVQASSSSRSPQTRFPASYMEVKVLFGGIEGFQDALAEHLGIVRSRSQDALILSGVREVELLVAQPELRTVVVTDGDKISYRNALNPDGSLTKAGITRGAAEGRMLNANAVATEFGSLEDFGAAVRGHLSFDPAEVFRQEIIDAAFAEVRYLEDHPDEKTILVNKLGKVVGQQAVDRRGRLTAIGLEQALSKGRMPPARFVNEFFPKASDLQAAMDAAQRSRARDGASRAASHDADGPV